MVVLHRVLREPQLLDAMDGVVSSQPGESDIIFIVASEENTETL